MSRFWSFATASFLGIWLVLMLAGRTAMFQDPGTFWHLRLGQETLRHAAVMRVDNLSFTAAGRQWVDAQWLPECVMAATFRCCGWDGLLLLATTILATTYALLAGRLAAGGMNAAAAVGLLALVLGASSHQFHVRPLIVTIALLAWTFCRLSDVEAGRRGLRSLVWLVPVFALWTNCHGGVLAGLGTLGLVVGGWCLQGPFAGVSPLRGMRDRLGALGLVAACAATTLLNPYGWELPRGWLRVIALPLPEIIQEHAPLDITQAYSWLTLLLAAVYLAVLAGTRPSRWSAVRLMPAVWLLLSVARVRNAPLFAVTAAIALGELLPLSRFAPWLIRRGWLRTVEVSAPNKRRWGAALLPLAVVAGVAVLQAAGVKASLAGRDWVQLEAQRWPVDLVGELRGIAAGPQDSVPVFNDMLYGGFLILQVPQARVFIDDRCELYGKEMLLSYCDAQFNRPARLEDWRREWHFRYALVPNGSAFDGYLAGQAAWSVVRRGGGAVLYAYGPRQSQKGVPIMRGARGHLAAKNSDFFKFDNGGI